MSLARLIGPELASLVRQRDWAVINDLLDNDIHPQDFADVLGGMDDQEAGEALGHLPTDYAAQVFERLEADKRASVATQIGIASTARIASEMDADDLADFVGGLPDDAEAQLIEHIEKLDPEIVVELEELKRWPETSAGGLMTPDYVALRPGLTIGEATEELRRRASQAETLDTLYVVDELRRVQGYLKLRDLLLTPSDTLVDSVMTRRVISVPPELDQEEVAQLFAKYDLSTLPVVDDSDELLGIITPDDILDVVVEEQGEDVHKMGAVAPIEESYLDASLFTHLKKRAPWLFILFIGGFLTASAMEAYDVVLSAVTQLAIYVPLLISAGGNSGAQSSTLVIRGLAVGNISVADWLRVLVRELAQGLLLGAMLAVLGAARVLLSGQGADMALLVASTIISIVLLGCVIGGMMPLLLHRVGIDPASSSTPFIATLVDVLGIVVYLGLAGWLLSDVLAHASP